MLTKPAAMARDSFCVPAGVFLILHPAFPAAWILLALTVPFPLRTLPAHLHGTRTPWSKTKHSCQCHCLACPWGYPTCCQNCQEASREKQRCRREQEEQDLLALTQGTCLKPGYHDPTSPPHKHGWQRSRRALLHPRKQHPSLHPSLSPRARRVVASKPSHGRNHPGHGSLSLLTTKTATHKASVGG